VARLLAALAEQEPEMARDPHSRVIVEQIAAAWAAVGSAAAPRRVMEAIAAGDPATVVAAWSGATGAARPGSAVAESALMTVARLGEQAGAVLAALGGPEPDGRRPGLQAGDPTAVDSPVAGVLLLARVVLDVRLTDLAERHGYPPNGPGHLLAAVGLRWAGMVDPDDGALDPAIRLLAGRDAPRTAHELAAGWHAVTSDAHNRWRGVVEELLSRHRLSPADPAAGPVDLTADALLRIWVRWLRGFEQSSIPFLLEQFVRRPGTIVERPDGVMVRLSGRPLDIVLKMSGYFRPIEVLPGTTGRRIEFAVGDPR
jgi:hypothetical protein